MTVIVTSSCLFNLGYKRFQREVNGLLTEGWELESLRVYKRGFFRTVFVAILTSEVSGFGFAAVRKSA